MFKNRCTVHVASDFLGTIIGNDCFFGEYSVIHACTIGNNVLVGENSVIMDGSIIGDNSIILADTLIPPGKIFKNNSLISGSPAKIVNKIDSGHMRFFKKNALKSKKSYLNYVSKIKTSFKKINLEGSNVFLSSDLQCNAEIKAQKNSSIWFSVIIHSPRKEGCVLLGEGSNIQDNSILNTKGEKIEIGKRVTIGHNVIIDGKAVIKEDAVIGMGSIIKKNCLVEKGAFVGAHSYVEKNTIIPEGQIYAGKPAKFFRSVTSKEKEFFSLGQKIYEKLTKEYIKINI